MTLYRHRSFRLSPNPHMIGHRVKTRLRIAHLFVSACRCSVIATSMVAFFIMVIRVPAAQLENNTHGILYALCPFFIVFVADHIGFFAGKRLASRCGLLCSSEASVLRRFMEHWPESWIEPLEDDAT